MIAGATSAENRSLGRDLVAQATKSGFCAKTLIHVTLAKYKKKQQK
jgi:hypothetical protein